MKKAISAKSGKNKKKVVSKEPLPKGRPTKYKPEYCEQLINFFSIDAYTEDNIIISGKNFSKEEKIKYANSLPTLEKFCNSINITIPTLHDWVKIYPDFSYAYMRAKELQKDILIQNGLLGLYNSQFATFVAINCTDMRNKTEVDHTTAGKPLTITEEEKLETAQKIACLFSGIINQEVKKIGLINN